MVYSFDGILDSNKKEQSTATHNNMDAAHSPNVGWKTLDTQKMQTL